MIVNKFSKTVWLKEDKKYKKLEKSIKLPNHLLKNVDCVVLKDPSDFNKIPEQEGGCYWIWTNEPVKHRLHKNQLPLRIYGGEIIYNGIAKDQVRLRVKLHLLGKEEESWSGLSTDIYLGKSDSHKKKAFSSSPKTKVPFIATASEGIVPIRTKANLLKLRLSKQERDFILRKNWEEYYFRNGINIFERKHKKYQFKVYYITGLRTLYLEYIEKKWREEYGLPKLCSYMSGR